MLNTPLPWPAARISKRTLAIAVCLIAAAAAHSEEYDGVHALTRENTRAEILLQGPIAARTGNPYGDNQAEGPLVFTSTLARSEVHAQGMARAHDRYHALDRWQFYRDTIPAEFYKPKMTFGASSS